jgi:hypothetical protein
MVKKKNWEEAGRREKLLTASRARRGFGRERDDVADIGFG